MFRILSFGGHLEADVLGPLRDALPALGLDAATEAALGEAQVFGPFPTYVADAGAITASGRLDASLRLKAWTVLAMTGPRAAVAASLDARPPRVLTSVRGKRSAQALADALAALAAEAAARRWNPAAHWVRLLRLPEIGASCAWLTGRPGLVCATRFGTSQRPPTTVVTAPVFRAQVAAALAERRKARIRLEALPPNAEETLR